MAHRPSETRLRIEDARKIMEEKLIDNMRYLSRNELASYVKWPDVEKAVTMMRDILPPHVSDESIRKECHYIGNTLNHISQDWSKDKNYLPKRRIRSTKISVDSQDQSEINKDEHDMEPNLSLSSTKAGGSTDTLHGDARDHLRDPRDTEHLKVPSASASSTSQGGTTETSTMVPPVPRHCGSQCKQGGKEGPSMSRCNLCYTLYHDDCVQCPATSTDTPSAWWICEVCRQAPRCVAKMQKTITDLVNMVESLTENNKNLHSSVAKLIESNQTLSAQVQSLGEIKCTKCSATDATKETKKDGQILLIGDSTIRDVVSNDDKALYVVPRGGGKTGDILAMMKSVKPNTYTDVIIHVGTNDTSTKFPLEKIMTNMTNIIDTAKSISKSGHVTFSGICPRKDNDAAARKGDEVNGLFEDLCGEKGCVFIDHRDTFLRRNGDVIEDHLLMDGLHLSARCTRCLLENLSLSTKASGKLDGARPQWKGPWDGRPRGITRGQSAANQQTARASSRPPGFTQPQTRTSAPWQTNKPSA